MTEIPYDVLLKEACRQMLGKEQPEGREDWAKVMNFVAWNVDFRICREVCYAIARLNNAPLRRREIDEIVDFQAYDRAARDLASREQAAAQRSQAAEHEADEPKDRS